MGTPRPGTQNLRQMKHRGIEGRVERQVASFGTVSDAVRAADQRCEPLARGELLDECEHPGERATE
jgi:hypothetical protein